MGRLLCCVSLLLALGCEDAGVPAPAGPLERQDVVTLESHPSHQELERMTYCEREVEAAEVVCGPHGLELLLEDKNGDGVAERFEGTFENGLLVEQTYDQGSDGIDARTRFEYDAEGRQVRQITVHAASGEPLAEERRSYGEDGVTIEHWLAP